ncbi:hypothetical protein BLNAU_1064 [Blattamonas nauphoetae]|uniref:Uncharacterized protein n=1 Tax=Blattamonas nauphoetae TaxID=2049346 RepID=A0ABQ9YJS5_9EUKA|nr:hypothetical protein BLNAU_1064 [Blattamonas nauphoetae]
MDNPFDSPNFLSAYLDRFSLDTRFVPEESTPDGLTLITVSIEATVLRNPYRTRLIASLGDDSKVSNELMLADQNETAFPFFSKTPLTFSYDPETPHPSVNIGLFTENKDSSLTPLAFGQISSEDIETLNENVPSSYFLPLSIREACQPAILLRPEPFNRDLKRESALYSDDISVNARGRTYFEQWVNNPSVVAVMKISVMWTPAKPRPELIPRSVSDLTQNPQPDRDQTILVAPRPVTVQFAFFTVESSKPVPAALTKYGITVTTTDGLNIVRKTQNYSHFQTARSAPPEKGKKATLTPFQSLRAPICEEVNVTTDVRSPLIVSIVTPGGKNEPDQVLSSFAIPLDITPTKAVLYRLINAVDDAKGLSVSFGLHISHESPIKLHTRTTVKGSYEDEDMGLYQFRANVSIIPQLTADAKLNIPPVIVLKHVTKENQETRDKTAKTGKFEASATQALQKPETSQPIVFSTVSYQSLPDASNPISKTSEELQIEQDSFVKASADKPDEVFSSAKLIPQTSVLKLPEPIAGLLGLHFNTTFDGVTTFSTQISCPGKPILPDKPNPKMADFKKEEAKYKKVEEALKKAAQEMTVAVELFDFSTHFVVRGDQAATAQTKIVEERWKKEKRLNDVLGMRAFAVCPSVLVKHHTDEELAEKTAKEKKKMEEQNKGDGELVFDVYAKPLLLSHAQSAPVTLLSLQKNGKVEGDPTLSKVVFACEVEELVDMAVSEAEEMKGGYIERRGWKYAVVDEQLNETEMDEVSMFDGEKAEKGPVVMGVEQHLNWGAHQGGVNPFVLSEADLQAIEDEKARKEEEEKEKKRQEEERLAMIAKMSEVEKKERGDMLEQDRHSTVLLQFSLRELELQLKEKEAMIEREKEDLRRERDRIREVSLMMAEDLSERERIVLREQEELEQGLAEEAEMLKMGQEDLYARQGMKAEEMEKEESAMREQSSQINAQMLIVQEERLREEEERKRREQARVEEVERMRMEREDSKAWAEKKQDERAAFELEDGLSRLQRLEEQQLEKFAEWRGMAEADLDGQKAISSVAMTQLDSETEARREWEDMQRVMMMEDILGRMVRVEEEREKVKEMEEESLAEQTRQKQDLEQERIVVLVDRRKNEEARSELAELQRKQEEARTIDEVMLSEKKKQLLDEEDRISQLRRNQEKDEAEWRDRRKAKEQKDERNRVQLRMMELEQEQFLANDAKQREEEFARREIAIREEAARKREEEGLEFQARLRQLAMEMDKQKEKERMLRGALENERREGKSRTDSLEAENARLVVTLRSTRTSLISAQNQNLAMIALMRGDENELATKLMEIRRSEEAALAREAQERDTNRKLISQLEHMRVENESLHSQLLTTPHSSQMTTPTSTRPRPDSSGWERRSKSPNSLPPLVSTPRSSKEKARPVIASPHSQAQPRYTPA